MTVRLVPTMGKGLNLPLAHSLLTTAIALLLGEAHATRGRAGGSHPRSGCATCEAMALERLREAQAMLAMALPQGSAVAQQAGAAGAAS